MQSLIIVLREGIEAALVVAIIYAYLSKAGKEDLKKNVNLGVGIAVLMSIITAIVLKMINFNPENEVLEGTMFLIAGLLVLSLLLWMKKTSKNINEEINSKMSGIMNKTTGQAFGITLFTFFMVFREGFETVLFIFTLSTEASAVSNILGALLGLALAVIFTYLFIKGSSNISLSKFFKVLNLILYILLVRLFAGAIHEFGEVQLIPLGPKVATILGYIVRDNSLILISIFIVTIPMLMMIFSKNKLDISNLTGTEKRIKVAEINKQRNIKIAALALIVTINGLLISEFVSIVTKKTIDPNPIKVSVNDGKIQIPVSNLGDSVLSKYSFDTEDGKIVRFIILKRDTNDYGVGFDACLVCGSKKGGYYQEQGNVDSIICKNCNAPIAIPTIGLPGGCNPIELKYEIKNDEIIINSDDLVKEKNVF